MNEIQISFFNGGKNQVLATLINSIPFEEQERLPHLLNIKARLLLDKGDNQAAIRAYVRTEQLYREEGLFDDCRPRPGESGSNVIANRSEE